MMVFFEINFDGAPIELPGAPFLAGALMVAISVYLCVQTLRKYEG